MEGRMTTRNCAAAGIFAAEKNYLCKRSWTAGLRARAGLALALTLLPLPCFTSSSGTLAAQQKTSGESAQEQNSVSKEVDQLRQEVGELREDLKRLHALLESHAAGSETASVPAPQPSAAVQPAIPSSGIVPQGESRTLDRKSTRLNSSHSQISYAVFCLKKKKIQKYTTQSRCPKQTTLQS